MRGLESEIQARLDVRLKPTGPIPIAVGLSGGSDSLALSLIAADWARAHGRPLLILTVDHRLRPESTAWTATCAEHAARMGARFQALAWTADKPATGLPAAAREARHALLANAARAAGAAVILLGHTADDLAESAAMRREGASVPDAQEWAPSPAWPEGRGLFLLRPMLGIARAELRAWLTGRGETWIEDPANADLRYARARARAADPTVEPASRRSIPHSLAQGVTAEIGGGLILDRDAFRAADPAEARALAGIAALCAAGTRRPPRGDRLDRLTEALRGEAAVVATLAGARIEADARTITWRREVGELRRARLEHMSLQAGNTGVWDGRFEVRTDRDITITALSGQARRLGPEAARALARLPAGGRGSLPVVAGVPITCPALAPVDGVMVRSLSLERLGGACGLVAREP
ncbi:tRNA lysidine(34) synthetase TilS [Phenylobacterium aquaticum]|uniref:tRNA lysidine(34) synthetase TilS n=1 Tax=Phenylobacterium aquaticum TaxID=1763816 RepID=UPI0026F27D07|nr:tRNA lysidine(34) synthetase TilS [Phenylobacterium aquaticum]